MKGTIVNYRSSRHRQKPNHIIIKPEGVTDKEEAGKLVGKPVFWSSPAGKKIAGKVASFHGNSGAVRVIFERGLPGQSVGGKVEIE